MDHENQEDGDVPVWTMKAVIRQSGLEGDEVMQARIKRLEATADAELIDAMKFDAYEVAHYCGKLRQIIANMYQIAGARDLPEHILDVLADPEDATVGQIDAMLPYRLEA